MNIMDFERNETLFSESVFPIDFYCNAVLNTEIYTDGNYLIAVQVRVQDTTEMYFTTGRMDANFFIDNNAPVIQILVPNGAESYQKPVTIEVDFNITDYAIPLFVDLNYSVFTAQGTGTALLTNESTDGINLLCGGDNFKTPQTCVYSWVANDVPDGNYRILLRVYDGLNSSFDISDANFEIKTPEVPVVVEGDHDNQYINPKSNQRDGNVYYNPKSAYNLTEDQKQTAGILNMQNLLFFLILIIMVSMLIVGGILWKRR